jgi:hypothetical protein
VLASSILWLPRDEETEKSPPGDNVGRYSGPHVALFAAGGSWRTLGKALIVVDVISVWFVVSAVREFRKLDEKKD